MFQELGLYYHTDTDCYYTYTEDKKNFVFHSYPVRSAATAALQAHEKRKARKHKMVYICNVDRFKLCIIFFCLKLKHYVIFYVVCRK